jgi:hypothetical protein
MIFFKEKEMKYGKREIESRHNNESSRLEL